MPENERAPKSIMDEGRLEGTNKNFIIIPDDNNN